MIPNDPAPPGEPGSSPHAPGPMLDYAKTDRTMRPVAQWCLGIATGALPTLAAAVVAPLLAGSIAAAVVGPLVVAALLAAIGIRLRSGVVYRPMAAGIWTGIGLAALVDGLCLATVSGMRIGG